MLFPRIISVLFCILVLGVACTPTDEDPGTDSPIVTGDDTPVGDETPTGDADSIIPTDDPGSDVTQTDDPGSDITVIDDTSNPDDPDDPWNHEDDDEDGIPNGVEGTGDKDLDGAPNHMDPDADGDGILDKDEAGADPETPANNDADDIPDYLDKDSDNDGIEDSQEVILGTDPTKKDSDGDGSDDYAEVVYGSDPTSDQSTIPAGLFYLVLPYNAPEDATRLLEFTTNINRVDVAVIIDVSGSMGEEIDNLKTGIKDQIITKVREKIVDSAFGLVHFQDWAEDTTKIVGYDQLISSDVNTVTASVDNLPAPYGGTEPHSEVLYQVSTGAGLYAQLMEMNIPGDIIDIPAADCTGAEGTIGGLCFRDKAMPIFIMITDESWEEIGVWPNMTKFNTNPPYEMGHYKEDAINAMNNINAKFIGVDTDGAGSTTCKNDFEQISEATASMDGNGNYFNFTMNSDGTGMSEKIAEAVETMTAAIQMDVNTDAVSDEECAGQNVAAFYKEGIPMEATPPENITGKDNSTFFDVEPGTLVTFDVHFRNDFCKNTTGNPVLYTAKVRVLGEGAFLSSREVNIIVPPFFDN